MARERRVKRKEIANHSCPRIQALLAQRRSAEKKVYELDREIRRAVKEERIEAETIRTAVPSYKNFETKSELTIPSDPKLIR